jgi:putative endonuclease
MDRRQPCVYILASQRNGTIYIGVTSELLNRIWQHKNDVVEGFTKRYRVHTLVWYELHPTMESAILREKAIKKWKRAWKMRLIEGENSVGRSLSGAAVTGLTSFAVEKPFCLRRNDEPKKINAF